MARHADGGLSAEKHLPCVCGFDNAHHPQSMAGCHNYINL